MAIKKQEQPAAPVINLMEIINDLAKEKGLERDFVIDIIQEAIVAAARKKLIRYENLEGEINRKTGEFELFYYKTVVPSVEDPYNELSISEANDIDPDAEEGDQVEYDVDYREFLRIAQSSRQMVLKRLRDAERDHVFDTFLERKGDILTGTVVRNETNGRVVININRTECYLFRREQIQGENFDNGDHVRVYLIDVNNDPKRLSQLDVSRTHPGLLIKLFEMEVPEIFDGHVEVVGAAREPGKRAKVSVQSNDPDIDPVGACVGVRGSRVQSIVSELRGEKIDIIKYNEDLPTYVQNALAPAEIVKMKIDPDAGEINVWVDSDQLSLAIGREGQNVRLASKLVGYKINISATEEKDTSSIEEQLLKEFQKGKETPKDSAPIEIEVVDEAVPTQTTEAPAAESASESPAAESASESPAAESTTEAAAAESVSEAPDVEGVSEAPAPESVSESPAPESTTEAAAAESASEAPAPESASKTPDVEGDDQALNLSSEAKAEEAKE